jgi:DNA-directed RNA polymerase subunit RPC12/RpoP
VSKSNRDKPVNRYQQKRGRCESCGKDRLLDLQNIAGTIDNPIYVYVCETCQEEEIEDQIEDEEEG